VWLARDADLGRATALLRSMEDDAARGGTLRCPECGEQSPGNFEVCWKCGHALHDAG